MYFIILAIVYALCLVLTNLMIRKHYIQVISELNEHFKEELAKLKVSFKDQNDSLKEELPNLIAGELPNNLTVKGNMRVVTLDTQLDVSKKFVAMLGPDELMSYLRREFAKQLSEQLFSLNNVFEIEEKSEIISDSKVYKIRFRLLAKED